MSEWKITIKRLCTTVSEDYATINVVAETRAQAEAIALESAAQDSDYFDDDDLCDMQWMDRVEVDHEPDLEVVEVVHVEEYKAE